MKPQQMEPSRYLVIAKDLLEMQRRLWLYAQELSPSSLSSDLDYSFGRCGALLEAAEQAVFNARNNLHSQFGGDRRFEHRCDDSQQSAEE